jgi:ribonuclease J
VLAKETGFPGENVLVIENGQVIEFENETLQIKDRIPGNYVFVDGSRVGEIGPSVVREREQLSQDGVVLISLVLDRKGKLHEEPEIISRGFVYKHDEDNLIDKTRQKVIEVVEKTQGDLHSELVQSIRSFLYNETKKRPVVLTTLNWL